MTDEHDDEVRKHYAIINTPNSIAAARAHRAAVVDAALRAERDRLREALTKRKAAEIARCDVKRRPANGCTHPKDRRIATYDEPGAFTCTACGLAVDAHSPEHAATPVAQHDKPRDLHLSTYDWTAACGDGGREVWHIDAGNEWDTREDAEAAIARHEARIRADERARIAKELHRMAAAEKESDQRSAGLHEAAMFVERGAK